MSSLCPDDRVRAPLLSSRWVKAAFVHWPCEAKVIQERLPAGLTVDEYDGCAWLSITPFVMTGIRPLGRSALPRIPVLADLSAMQPLQSLAEVRGTNLRTYVRGPDGRDGLWFLSLDTSNPALAVAARTLLGAPYHWSRITVEQRRDEISYSAARFGSQAFFELKVRSGNLREQTERDVWLTGRWRAYSRRAGRLLVTPVEHEPWPLRSGTVELMKQSLTRAVGLPGPHDPPVVHFSDGVHQVRTGFTRPL